MFVPDFFKVADTEQYLSMERFTALFALSWSTFP